jgi:GT2 family glycosyltransferase
MLSIIIINYNQKNFLKLCLKNIKEVNPSLDYEILIVDNNSKDDSLKFLSEIKDERVKIILNKKNLGYAKAINQALKISKGKYVLILNPDVIVLKGSIEKLYQFMEEHPECGIAGPKLLNPDKTIQYSCLKFPKWYTPILRRTFLSKLPFAKKHLKYYLMSEWDHKTIKEVDWLLGAALMVRTEAIKKVGLLDERFFLYFEDIDWCRRFHQHGFKVFYVPEASFYHFHQRFSAERAEFSFLFKKATWIHILSAIKYFLKWRKIK